MDGLLKLIQIETPVKGLKCLQSFRFQANDLPTQKLIELCNIDACQRLQVFTAAVQRGHLNNQLIEIPVQGAD